MRQKYIGRKTVNELRRRGKKVPDALTYEQIVTKINSAYLQVKAKDSDVITITKTPTYEALMSAKTPAEKRAAARYFSKLHDEYKYSFRDMAILLNNFGYVDSPQRTERQEKIVDSLVRKSERFSKEETHSKLQSYVTPKGKRSAAIAAGAKIRGVAKRNLVVLRRRLDKSLNSYPEYLRNIILGQIELKGETWLLTRIDGNLSDLDIVLSSDRELIEGGGEFIVHDFFELDRDLRADEDYIFKTVNLTGKSFNELISRYIL